jgi:hypothetical protein
MINAIKVITNMNSTEKKRATPLLSDRSDMNKQTMEDLFQGPLKSHCPSTSRHGYLAVLCCTHKIFYKKQMEPGRTHSSIPSHSATLPSGILHSKDR